MDYSQYKQLEFRRKFWKIFGATIHMTDVDGAHELGLVQMKAFRLRSDITLYADSNKQIPIFNIKARQAVALNYVFDVFDPHTSQVIFGLQRKGLKSAFIRDHWFLLNPDGSQFGEIIETSSSLALFRRWLSFISDLPALIFAFVPETYTIRTTGDQPQIIGTVIHKKNPFIVKMSLDTSQAQVATNPLVAIASCTLLCIRDASKNG